MRYCLVYIVYLWWMFVVRNISVRVCVWMRTGARAVRQLLSQIHQLSQRQDADRPCNRGSWQHCSDAVEVVNAWRWSLFHARSRKFRIHHLARFSCSSLFGPTQNTTRFAKTRWHLWLVVFHKSFLSCSFRKPLKLSLHTFRSFSDFFLFFCALHCMQCGLSNRKAVCLSVCLSVRETRALWQNEST